MAAETKTRLDETIESLSRTNIILGKNGSGKSYLLKNLESRLNLTQPNSLVRYLSPERGGLLKYEPGIEHSITQNENWLGDTRRKNQATEFRMQSAAQYRRYETMVLKAIEKNADLRSSPFTFDEELQQIDDLLERIKLQREDNGTFSLIDRETGGVVPSDSISSGESELISLGIECLVYTWECKAKDRGYLLIDEPDVHLHPDLQARFAEFLLRLQAKSNMSIVIATHSTSLVSSLAEVDDTRVAFLRGRDAALVFKAIKESLRKVLPIFGAHPLSNIYSQSPILLVEGEDDERIWQQAVRSSQGTIKVHPCGVDGLPALSSHEDEATSLLEVVYDTAVGYSLRDKDDKGGEIADKGRLKRMKLNCRAAENMILSKDVLDTQGITWEQCQERIQAWIVGNPQHQNVEIMKVFATEGFERRTFDLKDIRNDLVSIIGSRKQWEILVGQAIANFKRTPTNGDHTMRDYLGTRCCELLLGIPS